MTRRWLAVVVAAFVATPLLLTSCNNDEPTQPTITLFEPTVVPTTPGS
jgi:hypothetical protein